MGDRSYRSIGEVLSLLKDEFPDVTISKIRFLESQGLLDPERTASGYRKFYDPDVERLRWILRQQREHFLPLKVIKGRLGVAAGDDTADDEVDDNAGRPAPAEPVDALAHQSEPPAAAAGVGHPSTTEPAPPAPPAPAAEVSPALPPSTPLEPSTVRAAMPAPVDLPAVAVGVSLTLEELASTTGLPYDRLRELERSGFITGRPVAGTVYYDDEALEVANLALAFARFGVEGRHLRVYKNAAEREAGLFEQIVTPLLKQRNPEARRQAMASLDELAALGQSLRAAVLRQALRRLYGA